MPIRAGYDQSWGHAVRQSAGSRSSRKRSPAPPPASTPNPRPDPRPPPARTAPSRAKPTRHHRGAPSRSNPPTRPPCPPQTGSLPWSVASGSVPSSPISAAISASRRAIRYGENCTSPSTNTAAIGSAWSGEARSRLPDRPHRRPAQSPARRPARTGRHGPASRHPRLAHRHRPQTAKAPGRRGQPSPVRHPLSLRTHGQKPIERMVLRMSALKMRTRSLLQLHVQTEAAVVGYRDRAG